MLNILSFTTGVTVAAGFHNDMQESMDMVSMQSSCLDLNPAGVASYNSSINSVILGTSLSSSGKYILCILNQGNTDWNLASLLVTGLIPSLD